MSFLRFPLGYAAQRCSLKSFGRSASLALACGVASFLAGCSTINNSTGLDLGLLLAKDQQTFTVNHEKATLRSYPTGNHDIKLANSKKIVSLETGTKDISVANVSQLADAALVVIDAPEADCLHVYSIYRITPDGKASSWQNYRSCQAPMSFGVVRGQWSGRPTAKPTSGKPYILVYQDGNLYSQLVSSSTATSTARKSKPAATKPKAKPAPVSQGSNLDDIAAPAPEEDAGANLDDIPMPAAGSKIDTSGMKADKATEVKVTEDNS